MKSLYIWQAHSVLYPLCYADPQLYLRDHQSPGSNCGASVSPAARECYRDSRQPHPGGRRYVTMAYNPSLRYCILWLQLRYCYVPAGCFDQSFLCSLPSTAQQIILRWMCVFVNSRWHSLPACYSRHSSGPGGNAGSLSRDNTRPKQSGSTSRFSLCDCFAHVWQALCKPVLPKMGGVHEPSHEILLASKWGLT